MATGSMTTNHAPLIRLSAVRKQYGNGTLALDDVSFDVAPQSFVSLVGPSGCGKSTILRIVAGLGEASAGSVLVDGLPPRRARRERNEMAFVFQDATLMPWRTVLGNVELPLQLRGQPAEQRRQAAVAALDTVGLREHAHAYPRELSGGMRMRVSIARALVAGPNVLLMDEPFGALDEITRQHLNGEFLRICAVAGWTVLFVTHNVFEAVFLSSRVLVMTDRPGHIAADIPIDLPYPRAAQLRTTPEYTALVARVTAALHLQQPEAAYA
jgi:NitT/TauT family transport system ATP-binding protein